MDTLTLLTASGAVCPIFSILLRIILLLTWHPGKSLLHISLEKTMVKVLKYCALTLKQETKKVYNFVIIELLGIKLIEFIIKIKK